MPRLTSISTRTCTCYPYTTLFRSGPGHVAVGPIGRPDAVALHVPLEPGPDRGTRGAVRPRRLEGLRGELPDPGHVADQRPDLLRRCLDLHGHLTAERLDDLHRVLLQLVLPSSRAVADGLIAPTDVLGVSGWVN